MGSHRKIRESKLLKLKKWVTVAEAARLLTASFDEEISEADVLGLALDIKIMLSVNFLSGVFGKVCLNNGDEFAEIMKEDYPYGIWEKLKFGDELEPLSGVYDLPMLFGGRDIVQQRFRKLHGHPESEFDNDDEILVVGGGQKYKLHETFVKDILVEIEDGKPVNGPWVGPDSFGPLLDLDENCLLVVRTSALCELEETLASYDVGEPGASEAGQLVTGGSEEIKHQTIKNRDNDLRIIGVLLKVIMDNKLFETEEALRDFIELNAGGVNGCSKSNLGKKFPGAKRLLAGSLPSPPPSFMKG